MTVYFMEGDAPKPMPEGVHECVLDNGWHVVFRADNQPSVIVPSHPEADLWGGDIAVLFWNPTENRYVEMR